MVTTAPEHTAVASSPEDCRVEYCDAPRSRKATFEPRSKRRRTAPAESEHLPKRRRLPPKSIRFFVNNDRDVDSDSHDKAWPPADVDSRGLELFPVESDRLSPEAASRPSILTRCDACRSRGSACMWPQGPGGKDACVECVSAQVGCTITGGPGSCDIFIRWLRKSGAFPVRSAREETDASQPFVAQDNVEALSQLTNELRRHLTDLERRWTALQEVESQIWTILAKVELQVGRMRRVMQT